MFQLNRAGFQWDRSVLLLSLFAGLVGFSAQAGSEEAHGTHEAEHRHHIGMFLGGTFKADGEEGFSIGGEYEYRVIPQLGVGVLGEYTANHIDAWVVGTPFTWHVGGGAQFVAMPAVELHKGEANFLFRLGVGYEFEMEKFTIRPEINTDFVDGGIDVVAGASMGVSF